MKMGRRLVLLGMTLLVCSFIFGTVGVQAKKPVREDLTFVYLWDDFGDPKKQWINDKGILHTLQTPHYGDVIAGEIIGEVSYCGNLILDLATYSGKGGGIFEFTGKHNGEDAGFKGKLLFEIEYVMSIGAVLTGTLNCIGSGAFENILFKGTVVTVLGDDPNPTSVTLVFWT